MTAKEMFEALEYLKPFRWEDKKAKEAYELLKKALTPPTSDEVCKALSEYLEHTVITRKNKHGITFNYDGTKKQTIIRKNYDLLNIKLLLPLHLITLISRFYEELEK